MFDEHKIFIRELEKLLLHIDNYSLEKIKKYIDSCSVLFKKKWGSCNNYYIFRRNP